MKAMSDLVSATQRDTITRDRDIILEALSDYDEWMLDDDYDAMTVLHRIMKRMRERIRFAGDASDE
jgi:hypothetical protein